MNFQIIMSHVYMHSVGCGYSLASIKCFFVVFFSIQCNRTVSLRVLHTQIINSPTKIAAIGSGCSIATEASAEVSHFYNITQVLSMRGGGGGGGGGVPASDDTCSNAAL